MMKTCPLGHTCESCLWSIQLRGINPNTGQEVDDVKCAMVWMPMLMIENSQQQRQTSAAVESFRNEMIKGNGLFLEILASASDQKLLS